MTMPDLRFNADVSDESIDTLCDAVQEVITSGELTCRILLTSSGGDLFAAFGAYDRLKLFQRENFFTLEIVATGYCLSAGTVILQAAERRYTTPHTVFLLHPPEQFPWSESRPNIQPAELSGRAALHGVSVELLADIFAHGTDTKGWRRKLSTIGQEYFGADQALVLGLVDGILPVEGFICSTKVTCENS